MKHQVKSACRLSIVAFLAFGAPALSGAEVGPHSVTNATPPLLRPFTLRDAEGNAELGLVDPFSRRSGEDGPGEEARGEDGLMRTTMGEISSEFRILAIVIPEAEGAPRAALIQFYNADEPILVHEGDLVRVDRFGGERGGRRGRARVSRGAAAHNSAADAELERQLEKFVFYVNVKHIESTFIEVYHNKKRPDETIRLNW